MNMIKNARLYRITFEDTGGLHGRPSAQRWIGLFLFGRRSRLAPIAIDEVDAEGRVIAVGEVKDRRIDWPEPTPEPTTQRRSRKPAALTTTGDHE